MHRCRQMVCWKTDRSEVDGRDWGGRPPNKASNAATPNGQTPNHERNPGVNQDQNISTIIEIS